MGPWDMCSPPHRPILDPWSLQSVALMSPPLLQLRPRPQKQLPVPITTPATHTTSTCPQASLHHLPTTLQKIRRLSRPRLLPCPHPHGPFLPLLVGLHLAGVDQGGPYSSPCLIIKSYQELVLQEGRAPGLWRGVPPASHTNSAHSAPLTVSGAVLRSTGCSPCSCFTLVVPSHRGTLWPPPLLQFSPSVW